MKAYRCKETVRRYFDSGSYYPELAPEEDDELVEGCIILEDNHMFRHSVSPEFLEKHFDEVAGVVTQVEQNWRRGRWKRVGIVVVATIGIIWYLGKTWWS